MNALSGGYAVVKVLVRDWFPACLTIVSQVGDTYQRWLSEKNSLSLADTNSIAPEKPQGGSVAVIVILCNRRGT